MVTNIITNLKGSERGSERDVGDLSWTTRFKVERKREWGQTVLLTGLALALAACGGGGSSGGGGTPTQRASLAISEGADTGTVGDGVTNAAEVVLSVGQAPEGAVVRITRDGTQVGELLGLTSVTGGAEVRFASGIVEGQTGTFVATVLTSETNDTALSGAYEFTVDRELPAEVTLGTTELGTVDNPMARGDITQIEGTGEAGANVQVRLGEELLGEAKVGEDGTWVVTLDEAAQARLKAGENVLGIVQIDEAGNVSGQRTQRVHVEVEEANRVAQLSLISDTGETGDDITNGETVMLGVSAVEGKTLPAEAVVRITRDGEVIHEELALTGNEGEFRVNVNTQVLEGQTGTFVATVVASRTNETVLSRGYEFTVDRQPPEAPTITMGLGTASVPVVREEITQVEGTGEVGAKVQVRLGEELLGEARVGEDGTWVVTLDEAARARFTVGENVLGIEQEDVAGNVSEQRTQSLHVEVEEANRVARLSLVSDTGVTGDDITNGETVVLGVSAVEGKTPPADAVVRITRDGEVIHEGLALTGNEGEFRVNVNTQVLEGQTGTFVATVVASRTDDTVLSRGYEFTVDRQPPEEVTVVTELGTGEAPVARRTITQVEGTGETGASVRVRLGEELLGEARVGEEGTWVVTLDEAARARFTVGENVLGIEQEDGAGNVSEQRAQRVYLAEDLEIEIVLVSDTGVEGNGITNGETVVLGVTAREGTLPEEAVVRITRDGVPVGELLELTSVTGRAEVQFASQIGEGQTRTFVATVVASATDDTVLGQGYEFTVDRQVSLPTITTENLGTVEAPVFRNEVLGIEGAGETGATVRMRLGDQVIAQTEVKEDGTFGVTLDQEARDRLMEGMNTLEIVQEDVAGNVSEGMQWVVVVKDDPQPTASIRLSERTDRGVSNSDGITFFTDVDLEVTALGGDLDLNEAVVQITKEGVVVATLELNGETSVGFSSDIVVGQEGTFVARVLASATDDTPLSAVYEFTVDLQSPDLPTITTQNLGTQEEPMFRSELPLQFEGTGEVGGTVWLNIQNIHSSYALVGEDGRWVVELSETMRDLLKEGESTLIFWQQDVVGNSGPDRYVTVWVKEDAPIEVRVEPDTGTPGDDITSDQMVALVFSPAQGAPDLTNAVVQITKDGEVIHEGLALTGNEGEFQVSVSTQVMDGQTGTFVATVLTSATDDTVLGVRYEFTVDRQTPETPMITTENLGTVEAPVFRSEVLGIAGTGEAGVMVKVRLGDEVIAQTEVKEDGTFEVTWDQEARDRLMEGVNTLEIEQEDVAGNVSEGVDWVVVVKNDPQPTASIRMFAGHDSGASNSDGITRFSDVKLDVTSLGSSDLNRDEAVVQITREGVVVATLELNGATRVEFFSGIASGQEGTFVARVLASATDDTPLSSAYEFTVDRILPDQPTITTQNVGTQEDPVFRSEVLRIEGTGEAGANVRLGIVEGGSTFRTFITLSDELIGEDGRWVWELDEAVRDRLQMGENTLFFEQRDVAGNIGGRREVTVWVKENATVEVMLEPDTGVEGDGITNEQTVALVFNPAQGAPDLTNAVVQITKDGEIIHEGLALTGNEGEFRVSVNTQVLEGQTGTFVARLLTSATDDTSLGVRYEFTVDRQTPEAPAITTENLGTVEAPVFRSEVLGIAGTGEAGETVKVRLGDEVIAQTEVKEDGTFGITWDQEARDRLSEGLNTLEIVQEDEAGNVSESVQWVVVVKDDPQPTASIRLSERTDRGSSNSDGITRDIHPNLEVTAQEGVDLGEAVVQITRDGVVVATLELNGETRVGFSSGIAFKQEGTFVARVLASATDDTPLSAAYEFTVDRISPDQPKITTENLGTQEDPLFRSEVRFEGTGEAGGIAYLAIPSFQYVSVPIGEDGTWVWELSKGMRDRFLVGENTLNFRQEDVAGNSGPDRYVTVWVKEDASIELRMESPDTGVSGDGITTEQTVALVFNPAQGAPDLMNAVVQITKDGVVIHEGLALTGNAEKFRVSVDTQVLDGQTGMLVARVLASATDDTPLGVRYDFTVDRQTPEAPTITTDNLGTEAEPVFRSEVFGIVGTGEAGVMVKPFYDLNGGGKIVGTGEAGVMVKVRLGNEVIAQAAVKEDGTFWVALDQEAQDQLSEGMNTLEIVQEDGAGNVSEGANWAVVVKDDPQPTVSIRSSGHLDTGVSNSDGITRDYLFALRVTSLGGGDPDLDEAVVQITKEGVVVQTLELNGAKRVSFSTSIPFGFGQKGTFVARVLASATDDTPLSAAYEFTVDREPPEPPTLITTRNAGTQEDPVFRSEVSQFEGMGEAGGTVYLFIQSVRSSEAAIGENGSWVMELDEAARDRLQVGENTLLFRQEDVAGNSGYRRDVTVWVKEDAPIEVKMENDTGVQGDGITSEQTVVLVFSPAQGAPDLTNAVVQITKDGEIIQERLALTSNEGEFQVSVDTEVLDGQTGTFVAKVLTSATDDTPLGVRYEFTVDRQIPEAPTITTENLGTVEAPVFRSAVLGIAGTGEAGVTVKVRLGDEVIAQTEVREDGTFWVAWDQEARDQLSEGMNTLEIVQEDGAGNVSKGVDWVVIVKNDPQPTASIRLSESFDNGASNSDGITSFSVPDLDVTAQEGVDLGEAVVQITKEGVVVGTLELNGAARVGFLLEEEGTFLEKEGTFVARVLASATDDTPLSAAYEFTVDWQSPEAPTITTQNLGTQEDPLFRSEVLRIEGTGEAGGRVEVRLRDQEIAQTSVNEDGRWVLELDEAARDRLEEGENTLLFQQRDVAGNTKPGNSLRVWVKEDGSAVEMREPAEEVFVETEYAQEYAEILGVNSGEDTFYG